MIYTRNIHKLQDFLTIQLHCVFCYAEIMRKISHENKKNITHGLLGLPYCNDVTNSIHICIHIIYIY